MQKILISDGTNPIYELNPRSKLPNDCTVTVVPYEGDTLTLAPDDIDFAHTQDGINNLRGCFVEIAEKNPGFASELEQRGRRILAQKYKYRYKSKLLPDINLDYAGEKLRKKFIYKVPSYKGRNIWEDIALLYASDEYMDGILKGLNIYQIYFLIFL